MNRKQELAKNTAILTFGKICTQCISFLLLPLYTALLDTAEYGTFDLMVTYAALLLPLVNWQFDQGIFRFLLECRQDRKKQKEIFSTVFVTNTIQVLLYVLLLSIVCGVIGLDNGAFLAVYVVLQVYMAFLLQFVRGLGNNKAYAVASFLSASVAVGMNVVTLAVLRMGLMGLFAASLMSQAVTILFLCADIKPWKYFSIKALDWKIFKSISQYSLPLIPNNLAWWIVNVSDRTIISYVLGLSLNGIYTVANKFPNVFIQFYNILNLSWTETVSLHFQDEDRDEFLSETITVLYKLFSCICLGIVACMPFIFPLMINDNYADAYPQIIILMYAMLFRVMVGLYSCVYIATKESKKIAYTSAASAIINITINFLFINKIGLYAASISTLIAFMSMAIIRYISINQTIHMKIERHVLISSLVLAGVLMITYYMNRWVINCMMLLVVCIYALAMNWSIVVSAMRMAVNFVNKKLRI